MNINKIKLKDFETLIYKYKKADGLNYVYIALSLIPIFTIGLDLYTNIGIMKNLNMIFFLLSFSILFFILFLKNDTTKPLTNLIEYNKANNDFKLFMEYIKTKRKLYALEQHYLNTGEIKNIAISTNDLILSELHIYINS